MIYEFTVSGEYDGKKLIAFLRGGCAVSASLVRSVKFLENGIVVDNQSAKTDQIVREGQVVRINVPRKVNALSDSNITVPVVYESESIMVFNKPAGLATHPSFSDADDTLANVYATLVRRRGEEDAFRPVNRLDKNTSGLVLAAKNRYAAPLLAKSSQKQYYAIVEGDVERDEDTIDAPIARKSESIIQRSVQMGGAPSATYYKVLERYQTHTLIHVTPYTGRTHQIRVHMAYIGHPLAGDTLYGGNDTLIKRHALHCAVLSFAEPMANRRVEVRSHMPDDMKRLLEGLKIRELEKEIG